MRNVVILCAVISCCALVASGNSNKPTTQPVPPKSIIQVSREIRNIDDQEDAAIQALCELGFITDIRLNIPRLVIRFDNFKWSKLTQKQKEEFVLAMAMWYKKRLPDYLHKNLEVVVETTDFHGGSYRNGKLSAVK